MKRRDFIIKSSIAGVAFATAPNIFSQSHNKQNYKGIKFQSSGMGMLVNSYPRITSIAVLSK